MSLSSITARAISTPRARRSSGPRARRAFLEQSTSPAIRTSFPARIASFCPEFGAFADCRRGLDAAPGMLAAMTGAVCEKARPFLGICVGMQLLATRGLEYQTTPGLGWIGGDVAPIDSQGGRLRIPHMGWNTLQAASMHPLLAGIPAGEEGLHAYFVHSYAFKPERQDCVIAATDYGGPIAALIGRGNIAGTQFHPEKSQALGLALIANFLRWRP